MKAPEFYKIEEHSDKRGKLQFCNSFNLEKFKRFYVLSSAEVGQIRAWQAHKLEEKVFFPISGTIKLVLVPLVSFEMKEFETPIVKVLNSKEPDLVHIPGGYANGFQFLSERARLMVYSSFSLEESRTDDFRFDQDEFYNWRN